MDDAIAVRARRRAKTMCRYLGLALVLVALVAASDAKGSNDWPLVRTGFGKIRGAFTLTQRRAQVASFLGIPYAEAPVGKLRFADPQPWTFSWIKVRNATVDGPNCLQEDGHGRVVGSEDCLYLNVFVPMVSEGGNGSGDAKLPVLVYVHGGGFNEGSGDSRKYAPNYLLDQKIILVTVNYRLNAFGFFSTGDSVSPGNYGVKDVMVALRWINRNIKYFGGDSESVTLMGHSSGAAIAHHLSLTKKTEGLFDKCILHSGSALSTWALHPRTSIRRASLEMARMLGCHPRRDARRNVNETAENQSTVTPTEDAYENFTEEINAVITSCMRVVSAKRIVRATSRFHAWRENPMCTFGPTIENESDGAIITMHPEKVIKERLFRDIPMMLGVVEDEGLLKTLDLYTVINAQDELLNDFEKYIPYLLEYHEVVSNASLFSDALQAFYFDDDLPRRFTQNITELVGDGIVNWPVYQTAKYQSEGMNSSVYFYLFSYEGTFTATFASHVLLHYGVAHSDELNYLFPVHNYMFANLLLHNTENDWTMINIMTEMWSHFVATGEPSAILTPIWPDFRRGHEFMRIGNGRLPDVTVERDFLPARMAFWEQLAGNVTEHVAELEMIIDEPESIPIGDEDGASAACRSIFLIFLSVLVGLSLF